MNAVKILVVEDQPSVSSYILQELKAVGYADVHVEHTVTNAVALFKKINPEIILMDINLGDKTDGISLSKELKRIKDVPIIYATSYNDPSTLNRAMDTSPDGYLLKPFDRNDLQAAIETALYKNRLYQELLEANKRLKEEIEARKKSESQLKQSEKRYSQLLHGISDIVFVLDKNWNYLFANDAASRQGGLKHDELTGKNLFKIFPGVEETVFFTAYELVMSNRRKETVQDDFILPNGEKRWFEVHVYPIDDGILCIATDVTERKSTETILSENEEKYRGFIENSQDAFVLTDEQGAVIEWNQAQEHLSGIKASDVLGEKIWNIHSMFEIPNRKIDTHQLKDIMMEFFTTGSSSFIDKVREVGVVDQNGELREIQQRSFKVTTSAGYRLGAVSRDITDMKRAMGAMHEAQERFHLLSDVTFEGIILHKNGIPFEINRSFSRLTGYSREEIIGKNLAELMVLDEDKYLIKENIVKEVAAPYVVRARKKDGSLMHVEIEARNISYKGEKIRIAAIRDVSERMKADQKLKESEQKFRSFVENANDMLYSISPEGTFLYMSPNSIEITGYESHHYIGKSIAEFTHPEDIPRVGELFQKAVESGEKQNNIEYRAITKAGEYQWFSANGSPIFDEKGNIISFIGIAHNITERKNNERRLSSLAAIIENSNNIAVIKDLDLRIVATNNAFRKAAGKENISEMIGKTDAEIFQVSPTTEPIKTYTEDDRRAQKLKKGEKMISEEPVIFPDGKIRTYLTTKFPVFDKRENLIGTANISTDITAQKNTLEKLKQMLKYTESLAECSHHLLSGHPDSLTKGLKEILKTTGTSRVYIFENFTDLTGILCTKQIHEVCMPDVQSEMDNPLLQHLSYTGDFGEWESRLSNGEIINEVVKDLSPDIRELMEAQNIKSMLIIPVFIKEKWFGFIGFDDVEKEREWPEQDLKLLRTVSDLVGFYLQNKYSEQELIKNNEVLHSLNASKDKLMSIIGHDLKNPIGQIMGFVDLLIHNYDSYNNDKIQYFHKLVYRSVHQVSALLENLLHWSRSERGKLNPSPKRFDAALLADGTFSLLKVVALSKEIKLKNNIGREVYVCADPNMVDAVFRNLVSNAIKFTEKGGEVSINAINKEDEILFSVEDNGVGIKPEVKEKLFNVNLSYSTSGTSGETGTGLGLVICKEFIELNDGTLHVESQPGEGSTFYFSLPKAR